MLSKPVRYPKFFKLLFSLLFIFAFSSFAATHSWAAEHFSLHIVKYALDEKQAAQLQQQDGQQNPALKNAGYKPLANVQYQVQQVVPTGEVANMKGTDPTSYQVIGTTLTVQTDENGEAVIDSATEPKLVKGFYLVTELTNAEVTLPMDPVIIQLPMENKVDGSQVNDVYLYPKSSVATPEGGNPPGGKTPPGGNTPPNGNTPPGTTPPTTPSSPKTPGTPTTSTPNVPTESGGNYPATGGTKPVNSYPQTNSELRGSSAVIGFALLSTFTLASLLFLNKKR